MSANCPPNNNANDTPNKDDDKKPKSPRPSDKPRCPSLKEGNAQPNEKETTQRNSKSTNDTQASPSNRLEVQSSHVDLTDPKSTPPHRPETDNATIAESIVSSYDFLERNSLVTSLPDLNDISDNEGSLVEDNIGVKVPHHKEKSPDTE